MPEQSETTSVESNKTNDETRFYLAHNPVDVDVYLLEKLDAIKAGEATWMRRNFDSDDGEVYDFCKDGQLVGYVEHADSCWTAWIVSGETGEPLGTEFKSRPTAFWAVEESV